MTVFSKSILKLSIVCQATTLVTALICVACGNKIDTGRNSDPSQWLPHSDEANPTNEHLPNRDVSISRRSCFESTLEQIPAPILQFCHDHIMQEPAFAKLYPIICEQGKVISALNRPACGWDGNPETMTRYIHHYYMEADTSKDYEDIHASFVTVPVPSEKFLHAVRLVFENYDEFKRQGFQWVSGTREHRNLSGTTWEQGVTYRFRADKEAYEIGYQATNRLYQLTPNLWVHLNHAIGDYAKIMGFAQIVFYQQHPDQTSSTFKLEHRKVASQGYYEMAKKSGVELVRDVMAKGYRNATK